MAKYVIEFSKTGIICFTSHLDIMRVFKRAFKKAEIKQVYSQGFNPHPKMGFAQPLSLGYIGLQEYMEFETQEDHEPEHLLKVLSDLMPEGLDIKECRRLEGIKKTLAAVTDAAEYTVEIPAGNAGKAEELNSEEIKASYMKQERITALKKQKKKKDLAEIDIKPMIRKLEISKGEQKLTLHMILDSGSISNLSPELVITTFLKHFDIRTDRSEIEVTRNKIFFNKGIEF